MKYLILLSFVLLFSCKKEKKIIIDSIDDPLAEIFEVKPNWEGKLATIKIYKEDEFYASHQYFYNENGIPNGDIQINYGGTISDSFVIDIIDTIIEPLDTFGNYTKKAIFWNNIKNLRNKEYIGSDFVNLITDNQNVYFSSGRTIVSDDFIYNANLITRKKREQCFSQSVIDFMLCPTGTLDFQYPITSFDISFQICDLRPASDQNQRDVVNTTATHTNYENKLGLMFNFMYGDYSAEFIPYALLGMKVPNEYLIKSVDFQTYRNSFEYKFNIENQLSEINVIKNGDISVKNEYRAEFTYY
ncbi:MAG: hypothetical protein IPH74_02425 [Bacteroidetes bacterium]|nr:hypothetical protein [Bacteroidota bacterium]